MNLQCTVYGHEFEIIMNGYTPIKLMCSTCGEEYDVVKVAPNGTAQEGCKQ